MTCWPLFQYCNIFYNVTTFFLFLCLWLTLYNFCSVVFALCLPSSCLDNYFGQTECFPTAVALLTDVSLSDRLPRAKPGTLVATSFSAKFYFQFRKGFCFGFVITFAAEIQLYFLVEPGRKTQKVETDIQLMIGGKLNEMQVSLIAC